MVRPLYETIIVFNIFERQVRQANLRQNKVTLKRLISYDLIYLADYAYI